MQIRPFGCSTVVPDILFDVLEQGHPGDVVDGRRRVGVEGSYPGIAQVGVLREVLVVLQGAAEHEACLSARMHHVVLVLQDGGLEGFYVLEEAEVSAWSSDVLSEDVPDAHVGAPCSVVLYQVVQRRCHPEDGRLPVRGDRCSRSMEEDTMIKSYKKSIFLNLRAKYVSYNQLLDYRY